MSKLSAKHERERWRDWCRVAEAGERVPILSASLLEIFDALEAAEHERDEAQAEAARLREALDAWSQSLYPCPIDTCGCKAGHHLRRLDAEMVRQTRAALKPRDD